MTDDGPHGESAMAELQELGHGHSYDYEIGSPHLKHAALRAEITRRIENLVNEQGQGCHVLEVGAGHGGFTAQLLAAGARVTVTEMSRPSLAALEDRFRGDERVRCRYDADGDAAFKDGETYDLALCISVLHHIPDYEGFVARLTNLVRPGGAFASFQDPTWYPRRSRSVRSADASAYYLWRLGQGDFGGGLHTRLRRLRGVLDENNPADMVEYHVVRSGVDELALMDGLKESFANVECWEYWSTQSSSLQSLGTRLHLANTFGLVATGRSK